MNGVIVSCGRAIFVFVLAFLSSVVPKVLGSCVWSVRKFAGAKVSYVETGSMSILSSKPGAHGCYGFAGGVGLLFLESGGYDPY